MCEAMKRIKLIVKKKEQTLNDPKVLFNVCSKNMRVKIPFVFFSLEYKKIFVTYTRLDYWQIFIFSTLQKLKTPHLSSRYTKTNETLAYFLCNNHFINSIDAFKNSLPIISKLKSSQYFKPRI